MACYMFRNMCFFKSPHKGLYSIKKNLRDKYKNKKFIYWLIDLIKVAVFKFRKIYILFYWCFEKIYVLLLLLIINKGLYCLWIWCLMRNFFRFWCFVIPPVAVSSWRGHKVTVNPAAVCYVVFRYFFRVHGCCSCSADISGSFHQGD